MAKFPVRVFTRTNALLGRDDEYKSSLAGRKFAGMPKGVYVGFVPSVVSPILTLSPDPGEGYSIVKLPSSADPGGMDVVVTSPVTLDFTGQPAGDFPIHVLARAFYTDDAAVPTTAEIITRSVGPVGVNEVVICTLTGTAPALVIEADPSIGERTEPLAFAGIDFGFMPAGSIEDLQAATDMVNEVVAARVALDTTIHTSLSARLAADQSASALAGRLALALRVLRSNDHPILAAAEDVIVSGSLTEIDREHSPVSLGGLGDETTEGAVAAPFDTVRNVCIVVDATTGYRPVDNPSDRRLIFGRLEGPSEIVLSGTWSFVNADTSVSGVDGQATAEAKIGDTISGPDGLFYEIAAINSANSFTLKNAFTGFAAAKSDCVLQRWKLKLRKITGTAETSASLPAAATLRFFFPAFLRHDRSYGDWSAMLHSSAGKAPIAAATVADFGVGVLSTSGAVLGAVNIQNGGFPLAGGPFHAIDFNASNATVVTDAAGTVEVTEIGPQGATGPPGTSSGPGPPGDPGAGFTAINPFEVTGFTNGISPSTWVPFSYSKDMGHEIHYLAGGIRSYKDFAVFFAGFDSAEIQSLTAVGSTATITGRVRGDTSVSLFFSSAGS